MGYLGALFECGLDKTFVHSQSIFRTVDVDVGVEHHFLFYHLGIDHILAVNLGTLVGVHGLWRGRDAKLNRRIDSVEHNLGFVGGGGPKHVLFVDYRHDWQAEFLLRSASYLIERCGAFAVAHHYVLLFIDALPVHEKNFARPDSLALVEFVKHNGLQFSCFRKRPFQAHVTLQMQLSRSKPYESALLEACVAARFQLVDDIGERLASHHSLAGAGGSLEHHFATRTANVEQFYNLLGEFTDSVLLIFKRFHSLPPFSVSKSPPNASSSSSDASWCVPALSSSGCGRRLGRMRI